MEFRSELKSFLLDVSTIELHNNQNLIFVLKNTREIDIYRLNGGDKLTTISLSKSNSVPTTLFSDDNNLIVGYKDGIMEVRLIHENFELLRLTDEEDASGPGSAKINVISGSDSYILVQADENGMLIYSKPSLLFYKWIMIGGHTTIISHTIKDHLLFVLTKTNEIHLLNFHRHRIWEQEVLAYDYIDIEFDGIYLYAATKSSVILYFPDDDSMNQRQKLVSQINFKDRIYSIVLLGNDLLIIFEESFKVMSLLESSSSQPQIQVSDYYKIPQNLNLRKIKYFYKDPHFDFNNSFKLLVLNQTKEDSYLLNFVINQK